MLSTRLSLLHSLLITATLAACGSSGGGAGVDGGGTGGDGQISPDAHQANQCSADLREVLDGNGFVIEECDGTAGCFQGECIAACDAAAGSQGNIGCEFKAATPHFYTGYTTPCFAIFIANTWPTSAALEVVRDGVTYDLSTFGRVATANTPESQWPAIPATGVPPGEVAVLFMSQSPSPSFACPVTPALVSDSAAVAGSGLNSAWTITSSVPVSAYDILPYGGASSFLPSAQLLYPVSAWGDNFIAVQPMPSNRGGGGPGWAQIVATSDATSVQMVPNVDLPAAGTIPATAAGTPLTFTLNAGQYVQWQLANGTDISGTIIASDAPVTFIGGDSYICYQSTTSQGGGCDSAHQQVPPVAALGSDYIASPYPDRGSAEESLWYRLVGAVDGTQLVYDPPQPQAPTTINQGQVIDFEAVNAFRVQSQDENNPFYVAQIMPGCTMTGNGGCNGDEDFTIVLPAAQYLSRYVFFTDASYLNTFLVVVRSKGAAGFADVNLDCLGAITGWEPVGTSGEFETTTVTLVSGGNSIGACLNGRHEATSEAPFGVTVWGTSSAASYSYPAGGNVSSINEVVIDPID